MRKKRQLSLLFVVLAANFGSVSADEFLNADLDSEKDTLRNFRFDEAVIVASPKETSFLKEQPLSASIFGKNELTRLSVRSMKGLSAFAPNFFMPDYGSRLTSATYVRGVGTRVNAPAVGQYVDNVAFTEKSAYDFSFIAATTSSWAGSTSRAPAPALLNWASL